MLIFPSLTERGFVQQNDYWSLYGQLAYDLTSALTPMVRCAIRMKTRLTGRVHRDLVGEFYYYRMSKEILRIAGELVRDVGLDWSVTEDAMVYGRVTRGYKTGGFPGGFAFSRRS